VGEAGVPLAGSPDCAIEPLDLLPAIGHAVPGRCSRGTKPSRWKPHLRSSAREPDLPERL